MDYGRNAIEVQDIWKSFGALQAVAGVGFAVPRGTVFCILGPNGAGKTTLLRMLTTVTRPTQGQAWIEGYNIQSDVLAVRQRIGVVDQENRFDRYFSIWHNLTLHARLHGMRRTDYEPRIRELLEHVDLYNRRNSLPEELSGGMQRRIALIRALIHRPQVLFLDEPTTGLDPQARMEIWEIIEQLKQEATFILTTHYMEEADRLSDRIMMMHQGRVVAQGTAQDLKREISLKNTYELVFTAPIAADYAIRLSAWLASHPDVAARIQMSQADSFRLVFAFDSPAELPVLIAQVNPADVLRVGQVEANLEDVFLTIANAQQALEEGKA